ncbi:reverse transcriptase, partial [Trifolium pratense]
MVTVAWKTICTPFDEGGLGLRPLKLINKAAMLRLCWNCVSSDADWAQLVRARCIRNGHPIRYHISSSIWSGVKNHITSVKEHSFWLLGDGSRINFWTDKWLQDSSIADIIQIPPNVSHLLSSKVSEYLHELNWSIPQFISLIHPNLIEDIKKLVLPIIPFPDKLIWSGT